MDLALVKFFDVLHQEGALPTTGSRLMAAICYFFPSMCSRMTVAFPQAMRALKGWEKLCPA
eukprot:3213551-Karenia_brevis.AAC.1